MNSKQAKVLRQVFTDPVSANLDWVDVENLLLSVGCQLIEGSGSRVRFVFSDRMASFHRPHPEHTAKRYQIRDARVFLRQIGIEP